MRLRRTARRHEAGFVSEDYWAFAPGDRVLTVEGIMGTVTAVEDGPHAGNEQYEVLLDADMGGGAYSSEELTAADPISTEAGRFPCDGSKTEPMPSEETEPGHRTTTFQFGNGNTMVQHHSADYGVCEVCQEPKILLKSGLLPKHDRYVSWKDQGEQGLRPTSALKACDDCEEEYQEQKEASVEAAGIHTADMDYPELGTILTDRPDYEHSLPLPGSMSLFSSKKHIASLNAEGTQVEAGTFDKALDAIDKGLDPRYRRGYGGESPSHDWCRFRKRRRCWFPETLNAAATAEAGYAVWIPKDRGICPRDAWDDQRACPVGEPGPFSRDPNALIDATIPWEEGGQHGGHVGSLNKEAGYAWRDSGIPLTDEDLIDLGVEHGGMDREHLEGVKRYDKPGWQKAKEQIQRNVLTKLWGNPNAILTMTNVPFEPYVDGWTPEIGRQKAREFMEEMGLPPLAASKGDQEFGFHLTASWKDVRAKAKRIRTAGEVRIISTSGLNIVGEVKGDHYLYETRLLRSLGGKTVAMWECGCAWASYAWGRTGRWKRYEGRMCSHALALVYEAQSQEMFGGTIKEQDGKPVWRGDSTEVVRQPTNYPKPKRKASLEVEGRRPQIDGRELTEMPTPPEEKGPNKIVNLTDMAIDEIADWMIDEVKGEEASITRTFVSVANHLMGELVGLPFRFKGKDSLVRKIRTKMISKGRSLDSILRDPFSLIGDALRYTLTFPEPDWGNSVQKAYWMFQEAGFAIKDKSEENTWRRGDSYSGLHVTLISPRAKLPIELQFHTSDSVHLKEKVLHKMYEEFRHPKTPLARRQELYDLMVPYWEDIPIPNHALDFPQLIDLDRPTAMRRVNAASDLDEPPINLMSEALRAGPMKGKVRGRVVTLNHIMGDTVVIDSGEEVPSAIIFYPTWDPSLGLDFYDSSPHVGSANTKGVMVALVPPIGVAKGLAEMGTEPADEMHITLLYIGDSVDDADKLINTVASVAANTPVLEGHIGGFGVFNQGHTGEKVIWASWDVPGIEHLKVALEEALSAVGIEQGSEHGYTPHMTLSYGGEGVPDALPENLQGDHPFHDIVVAVGGTWTHIPLGGINKAATMLTDWAPKGDFGTKADGYGGSTVIWTDQAGNVHGGNSAYPYDVWWADPSSWDGGIDLDSDPLPFTGSKEAGAVEGLERDLVRSFNDNDVPDTGEQVAVYRDLSNAPKSGYPQKESWSIKRKKSGNVVAHTQGLRIVNVTPVFAEGERRRLQEAGLRGPHAYLAGAVDDYVQTGSGRPVSYYPDVSVFFLEDSRRELLSATAMNFVKDKCLAEGAREGDIVQPSPKWEPELYARWQQTHAASKKSELHDEEEPALPSTTADEDEIDEHLFEAAINAAVVQEALDDPSPIVQEAMAEIVTESLVVDPPGPSDPRLAWLMQDSPKGGSDDGMDFAAAARAHLAKEAMKTFTPAEQQAIIGEGEGVVTSNLDRLDIGGTHYEALEAALSGREDEDELWL